MSGKNPAHSAAPQNAEVASILRELTTIRAQLVDGAATAQSQLDAVHPSCQDSARNLLHYLALRRHDVRPLQLRLAALGLSSLGRSESHVLATVDAVLGVLQRLQQRDGQPPAAESVIDFNRGQSLLAQHTEALFGPDASVRGVRIMVTMPSEAATEYSLIHDLLQHGMNCMRINCAHDDAAAWLQMVEHLRRAERELGRSCKVVMDLAGPKLRTGPLLPGPAVVRIRPQRDVQGRVTAPARVWLTAENSPHPPAEPASVSLPVPARWLKGLRTGQRVKLTDARAAKRTWHIVEVTDHGCWAEATQTAYVVPGTNLRYDRGKSRVSADEVAVGELPATESAISVQQGDVLILTGNLDPGRPATYDKDGHVLTPAEIGCTIPAVFADLRPGESIWFDDGKIGGVVESLADNRALVRINQVRLGGRRLRADKGINLPDSDLHLAALTEKDLADLPFVAEHADIVELSFANSVKDVELLQQHLAGLRSRSPAIVLKIETRRGFENLPDMLLAAMRVPCSGVMIARGDLAVECGFERLAEVQEEILWISEAAHVPVIWATQVLETLAQEGLPSRAEVTDAAMGHRAECVMLNKGPYVVSAVQILDGILRRMQAHQTKKQAMLRELRLAHTPPAST